MNDEKQAPEESPPDPDLGVGKGLRWARWEARLRDAIIFAVGIIGSLNEVFLMTDPRPTVLVFLGSLIGVPFILNAEDKAKR